MLAGMIDPIVKAIVKRAMTIYIIRVTKTFRKLSSI